MNDPPITEKHEKELLDLGKKLEVFYRTGYISKKKSLYFAFLQGLMSGLGAVVGGTIVIALILWLLSFFKQVPLIGPVSDNINHTLRLRVK
jgi:hypothetical protein